MTKGNVTKQKCSVSPNATALHQCYQTTSL